MRAASIHRRPMEVSDEQGVFYLHGALGAGQSRRGAGVETANGDDLQGASRDNICLQVSDELLCICFATRWPSRKAVRRLVLEVKLKRWRY